MYPMFVRSSGSRNSPDLRNGLRLKSNKMNDGERGKWPVWLDSVFGPDNCIDQVCASCRYSGNIIRHSPDGYRVARHAIMPAEPGRRLTRSVRHSHP